MRSAILSTLLLVPGVVQARADCKTDIIAILDTARTHGPSQEETVRVLTSRKHGTKPKVVSRIGTIVRTMPPDRTHVRVFRSGKTAAESIFIGTQHWAREPGKKWKLGPPIQAPILEHLADDLRQSVSGAQCHGSTTLEGHPTNHFTYTMTAMGMTSKAHLWVTPPTNRPHRWVVVASFEEIETTMTTNYSYDPTIVIEPPSVGD